MDGGFLRTSVEGYEFEFLAVMKRTGFLGFDFHVRYRENWAPDLMRVVDYVDVPILRAGVGLSLSL